MREWCSPAVLRAIDFASFLSGGIGGNEMAADKLLLGLLEDEDGRATTLLAKHGGAGNALRQWLATASSFGKVSIDRVVDKARTWSRAHDGEETTTSEYFLLALLQESPELSLLLAEHRLDRAALEREILAEAVSQMPMLDPIELEESSEGLAAGRIIDVNANRARESLRILDDYARFVLDDAFLTKNVKQFRHDLVALLESLPENSLLGSRETILDVGTAIGTAMEMERTSPGDVARVNLKRLQESLRSMEEFGKIDRPTFAEGIELLRYRVYTLEKALMLGSFARKKLAEARLCVLLTGSHASRLSIGRSRKRRRAARTFFNFARNISTIAVCWNAPEMCAGGRGRSMLFSS